MAVTAQEVITAYQQVFGRTPAQDEIDHHVGIPHAGLQGLIGNLQQSQEFRDRNRPTPATPPAPQLTPPPTPPSIPAPDLATEQRNQERRNAFDRIKSVLGQYGLGDLADWAWQQIVSDRSEAGVLLDLQEQPTFKQRFKAIDQRRQKGLPAISPAEVIEFENSARAMFRAAGLPQNFYDSPDDFTNFLVGDVSLAELDRRVALAQQAVFNQDPILRAQRARFGVTPGEEVAMALDPSRAFPELARRFASAGLSAHGVRTGFGELSESEAGSLVDLGVTEDQAQQGFTQLAGAQELFTPLAGTQEQAISRKTQLDAVFGGDAQAQREIDKRASKRRATFGGGGAFAQTRAGIAGLGASR